MTRENLMQCLIGQTVANDGRALFAAMRSLDPGILQQRHIGDFRFEMTAPGRTYAILTWPADPEHRTIQILNINIR